MPVPTEIFTKTSTSENLTSNFPALDLIVRKPPLKVNILGILGKYLPY